MSPKQETDQFLLSQVNYFLYESSSGYALFERLESEEIGSKLADVCAAATDITKFGKMVKLKSFAPFKSAAHALENMNDVSEGIMNDHLKAFLEMNLPKPGKKSKVVLGVTEKSLAGSIKDGLGVECDAGEIVLDLVRGVRLFADKLLKQLKDGDLERAQLGLGHSYSRGKVKFNVHRSDNMIMQAIALLDQMDKDVNTFAMRIREWYSWHFPELVKIVNDNYKYAKLAQLIKNKSDLSESKLEALEEITGDATQAQQIIDAARASMGTDISVIDMINIENFAKRVIDLADYRKKLHEYLISKMNSVAPNLSALIGEMVGARLISHAGSLTNLSKYPASTVQILGAEKALFRALKTKGNTPKYGLIYHSSFIGRAGAKNKGRISRFVANKCSIASRIDCFSDVPTTKFGEAMKEQVEERLEFYESGATPSKNADTMRKVIDGLKDAADVDMEEAPVKAGKKRSAEEDKEPAKKAKKEKSDKEDKKEKKEKKEKKDKKEKKEKK
ncbi:snoRNP complex protein nop56 [Dissophora globulifera]|uniref:Nucleolar protein 56 n=1 Tax=Dissophora globulifera TaxID=979702 RepID=A0A9P6RS86_9FUNG|nr:snoRNP complex protein nop56 [Dissophora globulifera]